MENEAKRTQIENPHFSEANILFAMYCIIVGFKKNWVRLVIWVLADGHREARQSVEFGLRSAAYHRRA
ncbi:MAG TPA: hypothetical protein VL527_12560 [Dongiaceae bacterium]|nr:hypothetical protein [Dongiaceae bacterium]